MATNDVSSTRLYLGNLPRNATKSDVENHFNSHGTGEITEIKLMNGFGFIEYKDAMDARDVVPDGSDFMGERLVVQFARGSRRPDGYHDAPRAAPRPRRTQFRMTITGLPVETSWQDLKDFARQSGLDVVYSEVGRERDGAGAGKGFVEYETADDLRSAVEKLDGTDFKGAAVRCIPDTQAEVPRPPPRDRYRSRSPGPRRGFGGGHPYDGDYYDRRGPPRAWSPRRDDYRRRTPPREYYDNRGRYGRSPPRGGPHDDYPPPRRPYPEDPYDRARPPPRDGYPADPYVNGHGRSGGYGGGYDRPPSPRRPRSPRGGYPEERRPYW
ncbi:MAG: hypothetical protein M1820_007414 [Bogoriella megaspora]|nr:MAG: hypothetical protein M1820_007414 [Bogoriella megaspora]